MFTASARRCTASAVRMFWPLGLFLLVSQGCTASAVTCTAEHEAQIAMLQQTRRAMYTGFAASWLVLSWPAAR
eukprot:1399624-Karenia_brevis.AAC.1